MPFHHLFLLCSVFSFSSVLRYDERIIGIYKELRCMLFPSLKKKQNSSSSSSSSRAIETSFDPNIAAFYPSLSRISNNLISAEHRRLIIRSTSSSHRRPKIDTSIPHLHLPLPQTNLLNLTTINPPPITPPQKNK